MLNLNVNDITKNLKKRNSIIKELQSENKYLHKELKRHVTLLSKRSSILFVILNKINYFCIMRTDKEIIETIAKLESKLANPRMAIPENASIMEGYQKR